MEPKVFRTGEPVTAEFMTEVAQAVSNAEKKSDKAVNDSQAAKSDAADALTKSTLAESTANSANTMSNTAQNAAQLALEKAQEVERRANNHEFDGRDGTVVQEKGLFAFMIENGELCVYFSGDEVPNLSIDANGELIYNY